MPREIRTASRAQAVRKTSDNVKPLIVGHAYRRNGGRMLAESFVIALKKPVIGSRPTFCKIVRNGEEISRCLRPDSANDNLVDNEAKTQGLVVETCCGESSIEIDGALPEAAPSRQRAGGLWQSR
jgi:hypothetical protein